MKVKKLIALLLALVTVGLLASCKKPGIGPGADTTPTPPDTSGSEQKDSIGEYDFKNESFTVLMREETAYEFEPSAAGSGGALVSEAVYNRNHAVEERFNVKMVITKQKGNWTDRTPFMTAVRTEYMSGGVRHIDMVAGHSILIGSLATEGLSLDMTELPEMDFEKEWWNKNIYDEINLNGHVLFMLGDIGLTVYEYLQVMFVNKTVYNSLFTEEGDIESLYEMVDNGEWTWDELFGKAAEYGNGVEDGKYGLITNAHSWRASFYAQDANVYVRDSSTGKLTVPESMPEKLINVVKTMVEQYKKENIWFYLDAGFTPAEGTLNPIFSAGNALFYSQMLGVSQNLMESMSDDFIIVPLPKYNALQEQYKTICRDTLTAVMIIKSAEDTTKAGVITEALCMYSNQYVRPAYYETRLKTQYTDEPRTGEILDLIRSGLTFTAGESYLGESSFRVDVFHVAVINGQDTYATTYTSGVTGANKQLANFYNIMSQYWED